MGDKKSKRDFKDVIISFTKRAGDTTKKVIKGFKEGYKESYEKGSKGGSNKR